MSLHTSNRMLIHQGKPTGLNWPELIHSMADKEFASLTRSTLSVLCFWREREARIGEVLQELDFDGSSDAHLSFEYTVPSLGNNPPSFTDVMYLSRRTCIGFEGKYTERRYKTVGNWLGEQPSTNRRNVLRHWIEMIKPFSAACLDPVDFSDVVYQMLHRLASVCYRRDPDADQVALVYQVFVDGAEPHVDYATDLRELNRLVSPSGALRMALQIIEQVPTGAYRDLQVQFTDNRSDPMSVRRALLKNSFYEFSARPLIIFR